jgi:predicted GNAT family acetyltransferase
MRFQKRVNGHQAVADCDLTGDILTVQHTFVPPELRGQGIAEELTREALAWAKANKKKVVPQCSYTAAFFRKNPEFADLLAADT